MTTTLRDAAESATAGVPVVRGLVWDAAYDSTLSRATTVFGTYRVWTFAGARSWYWELAGSRSKQGARNSEDEAKAAAQADYEQRIRSALNPDFLSELDTARAEIERLRAALTFYQDGFTFIIDKRRPGLAWVPTETLLDDCGNIARIALADDPAAPSALSPAVKEPK